MANEGIGARIERRAHMMGIELSRRACDRLEMYHRMLMEANRTMNLTRVSQDEAEAVDRNYLDSLSPLLLPAPFAGARTLVDVGSGAGFPGIPLAIARPELRVVLLDSQGKRVRFLNEVIDALALNARAVHMRAEDAARLPAFRDQFDLATARAVAPLVTLVELALPLVRVGGTLIALKGPSLDEELATAQAALRRLNGRAGQVQRAPIPDRDWDHRLLPIVKQKRTPPDFPRKAGEAGRQPIQD